MQQSPSSNGKYTPTRWKMHAPLDAKPSATSESSFNTQIPTMHTYNYITNIACKPTQQHVKDALIKKFPKLSRYEKYSLKQVTRASRNHAYVTQQAPHFAYFGNAINPDTNPIRFIHLKDIPAGKKPTYLKMVVADRPQKINPRLVRNTIGGNRIQFDGDISTKAAKLTTCKIFVNSFISMPRARCVTSDLKDF